MTAEEVNRQRAQGWSSEEIVAGSPMLGEVIDAISSGVFSPDERERFQPISEALLHNDHFLVTADFDAYCRVQREVDALWRNQDAWWHASVMNTANMAYFSSDRAVGEYASEIWRTMPKG